MKKYNGLESILLVDDDTITNYLNKQIIKRAAVDASVKVTSSSMEALVFLNKNNTSIIEGCNPYSGLIFLDINMPGMNGWEFLEQLSKEKTNVNKAVIVMLSSSISNAYIKMADDHLNVKEFISKPLKIEDFKHLVDKYFNYK